MPTVNGIKLGFDMEWGFLVYTANVGIMLFIVFDHDRDFLSNATILQESIMPYDISNFEQ